MIRQIWMRLRQWIWVNRNASKPLLRGIARGLGDCIAFAREVKGLFTSRNARSVAFMKLFRNRRTHQTTSATAMDRYPAIFAACRERLQDKQDLRILSFGCATGEEVFTLRQYFPHATIVGAEINRSCLAVCRSRNQDENIHFIDSLPENLEKFAPYDAIFCMAVFQRSPEHVFYRRIRDLKKIYPFEKFQKQVNILHPMLKAGGLLVIQFSQYDFSDTAVSADYAPIAGCNQDEYGPFVFGPDSKLKKQWRNRPCIFEKLK
jgi:SAM-dependent methyltransferase